MLIRLLLLILLLPVSANAASWYVRSVGGSTSQCTGHTDADYPGSGVGQPCAYANPQDAFTAAALGDTIYLEAGATFSSGGYGFADKGAGTSFITVTTNGTIPSFTSTYPSTYVNGVYTRVTTAMAVTMPKLITTADQPVLSFQNNAHHWLIKGIELSNNTPAQTIQQLVGTNLNNSYITLEDNWLHPQEENGTDSNIAERSINQAIIANGDNLIFRRNAITGFTGYSYGFGFRLEASCILSVSMTNTLIENNLCEVNGQYFIGGGGGVDPAHSTTFTGSPTLTSGTLAQVAATDLDINDMIAIHNTTYANNHLSPNSQTAPTSYDPVSSYQNGRITAVNHGTGALTFTSITSGLNYRQFNLFRFVATGGSYRLVWMGQTTAPITYNADKATIRAALEALSNVVAQDFQIRSAADDGWPYADFMINFNKGEDGNPGAWSYPTPINPLTIISSLTGGNAPGYIGAYAAESYSPSEVSADGTSWDDTPTAGMGVTWEGTQAHDVTVRRNIFAKRHVWTAATGDVKGFIEQKGCSPNCTYDGNIFTGRTTGFVFTVRNQGGSVPWASNSGTEFTNNLWDEGGGTFDISNTDGAYELQADSHDILVHNNMVLWPGGFFDDNKHFMTLRGGYNITITHNTAFVGLYVLSGVGFIPVTSGLVIQDNIFRWESYTVPCFDTPGCFTSYTVSNNLLFNQKGADSSSWFSTFTVGTSAWEEPNNTNIKFMALCTNVDGAGDSTLQIGCGSNYNLDPTSIYAAGNARDASDGKDLGCIIPEMVTAMGYSPFSGGISTTVCSWSTNPPCQ